MQRSQIMNYKVLSLFSGCGGLDLGFQGGFRFLNKVFSENIFQIVWANDINHNACHTYRRYFNHPIICGDIREILVNNRKGLPNNLIPLEVDVVLGGFPCQDFSHSGKRKGFNSKRGTLYQAMSDIILRTKPKFFLAENVKGLLTINNGKAIGQIVQDFEAIGYHVSYNLLLTANFGVPQKRERVIIIGTRKNLLPKFDFAKLSSQNIDWMPVQQAIEDLENKHEGSVNNHFWSKAKKNKGQGNNAIAKECPAPTMRAEHHGNIEFHWNKKRRLSAREAARIQSFPDDFVFYPSTSSAYRQIGNAVPPVFAWHLAKEIGIFINQNLKKEKDCEQRVIGI